MKKIHSALLIANFLFFLSCSKSDKPSAPTETIYLAGITDSTGIWKSAKYWVNGVAHDLQDCADPKGMFVTDNGDVYIAGQGSSNSPYFTASYWKNGARVDLSVGQDEYESSSIWIHGIDVYVCGRGISGANWIAKYWKNGVEHILSDGTFSEVADKITVSGNDVYVCGSLEDAGHYYAKYWKNGVGVVFGNDSTYISDIVALGNDVYLCGTETNSSGYVVAKYWKNGVEHILSDGTNDVWPMDMVVEDDSVYLAGIRKINSVFSSVYWKNDTEFALPDPGAGFSQAWGISVKGNDIFVCGFSNSFVPSGNYAGKYWKNGDMPISLITGLGSQPKFIVVK